MSELIEAPPKSVQVAEIIRREIQMGRLEKGVKLQPIRKLGERYSVTNRIVQSAFDILRKEGLIESHVGRGTFVASEYSTLMSRMIPLFFSCTKIEHDQLFSLLPAQLQKHGFITCVINGSDLSDESVSNNISNLLKEQSGYCIVDANARIDSRLFDLIPPQTRLLIIRHDELKHNLKGSRILSDYVDGGRKACEYLLAQGRRKIAVVSMYRCPGNSSDLKQTGVEQVLSENGLDVHQYISRDDSDDVFINLFGQENRPDGIFVGNDYYYKKVKNAADYHGLVLGRDFDAVGYGNTPWAEGYGITTLDPNPDKLSEKIVEFLIQGKKMDIKIAPTLVINHQEHPKRLNRSQNQCEAL